MKSDATEPRRVADWDAYFMQIAQLVATRSKHPRSQHGAVLVGRNHRVVAMGYNGTPSGFPDDQVDWAPGMVAGNRDWTIPSRSPRGKMPTPNPAAFPARGPGSWPLNDKRKVQNAKWRRLPGVAAEDRRR